MNVIRGTFLIYLLADGENIKPLNKNVRKRGKSWILKKS